ncbi:MAG: hypothetical protein H0Z37_10275 [Firmicutes bacterium]|nr:hypothetical protein [Bacillota bacterium]
MSSAAAVVLAVASGAAARYLVPRFLTILHQAGLVRPNFRGRPIPASAGTALALVYGGALIGFAAWTSPPGYLDALILVTLGMALIGLADDALGDRSAAGLRGHLVPLLQGALTTGGLKALFGVVVGIGAAFRLSRELPHLTLNALLIPLAANGANLLDVRPGRAAKGFLLVSGALWLASPDPAPWTAVLPLMAAVAVYLPYDLKGRAMLGDAGANVLGGVAGAAAAASLPLIHKATLVALLVAMHMYAERGSLTELFERVAVLRWIDRLGRD